MCRSRLKRNRMKDLTRDEIIKSICRFTQIGAQATFPVAALWQLNTMGLEK